MKQQIQAKLSAAGIKNLTDVDTFARTHKESDGSIPSRFDVLSRLLGENVAIAMLHELSIRQCCKVVK